MSKFSFPYVQNAGYAVFITPYNDYISTLYVYYDYMLRNLRIIFLCDDLCQFVQYRSLLFRVNYCCIVITL